MNDLEKLFFAELKDVYDTEHQIVEALPEMEEMARSPQLKAAFRQHLSETRTQIDRLEQVFRQIGQEPKRKTCRGIEGIIDEGQSMAKEFKDNSALDAALIGAAQKVEHYEITSYGTMCSWAQQAGLTNVVTLLNENLAEEKQTDQKLTLLAESSRNPEATRHDTDVHEGFLSKLAA